MATLNVWLLKWAEPIAAARLSKAQPVVAAHQSNTLNYYCYYYNYYDR